MANAPVSLADVPLVSARAQDAWRAYLTEIDAARAKLLNSRWAKSPGFQVQAMYYIAMLQQFGFNTYLGPRQAFPTMYQHLMNTPVEAAWGTPCPDFRYRWTAIDGARTYRIWGTRGKTPWFNIQAQRGWYGDENTNVGAWDIDDFELGPDGSFEIIASATKPQTGNWMKLDPNDHYTCMVIRDICDDWDERDLGTIHIQCLDVIEGDDGLFHSEEEFCKRLLKIARQTTVSVDFFLWTVDIVFDEVGFNTFRLLQTRGGEHAGSQRADYIHILYDIQPDEAVIVECKLPKTRYWGLQMADWLQQSTDYRFHHTSVNNRQAHIDKDGAVRLVIAAKDPGVKNWIDTCGQLQGLGLWRYYLADEAVVPSARKVKLADLKSELPAETARVSPEERRAIIEKRIKQVGDRFNV